MQSLSPGWRVLDPVQLRPTSGPVALPGAPSCAVLARPCKLKKMQNCPRRRDISARRGPRTRRRGRVMPRRGNSFKTILKQFCRFLLLDRAFHSYFFGQILNLDLGKPHSLSLRFAENLSSQCQHVIRARGSKHVMQRKINIEFKSSVFA